MESIHLRKNMKKMAFLDLQNDLYLEQNYLYGSIETFGLCLFSFQRTSDTKQYSLGLTALSRVEYSAFRGSEAM